MLGKNSIYVFRSQFLSLVLITTLYSLSNGIKSESCMQIPGFQSPIEIFQEYFESIYDDMSPEQKSNMELIKITE